MTHPLLPGCLSAAMALAATVAPAQTTTGVPCALDNTLYENATGALSNAIGPSVFVGLTGQGTARRALLQFDVASAIPAGARVVGAVLRVHVVASSATQPTPVTGHVVTASWGEGTSNASAGGGGGGTASTTGDATWIHRFFPSTLWASAGGDFVAAADFTTSMPPSGFAEAVVDAATVQGWLDQPATNSGWLLKTSEQGAHDQARRIDSRESAANNPMLVVTWMLPGQTGTWGDGCPVGVMTAATSFAAAPAGGAPIGIAHSAFPASSIGADYFSLELDPIGMLLAPSCRVYLDLGPTFVPGAIFLTDAGGASTTSLFLPAGFPGQLVVAQGAVLDGSAFGVALGNAALLVLP